MLYSLCTASVIPLLAIPSSREVSVVQSGPLNFVHAPVDTKYQLRICYVIKSTTSYTVDSCC